MGTKAVSYTDLIRSVLKQPHVSQLRGCASAPIRADKIEFARFRSVRGIGVARAVEENDPLAILVPHEAKAKVLELGVVEELEVV